MPRTRNRDDFRRPVIRDLEGRVGSRCSNPTCNAQTRGPRSGPEGVVSIGVAAHITAAAPGGPRYDPSLMQQQRESPENGIWLCQNCQIRVDRDTARYSTKLLKSWKSLAEINADQSLGRPFDRSQDLELEILSDIPPTTNRSWTPDVNAYLEALKSADEQHEVLATGTGLHGQPYVITAVPSNCGWDWVLTFSVAGEFGWEAISRLALEGQKGCTPEASYVPGVPGALSVTHLNGYGTGVFRRSTTLFRIKRGELTPMLSYPYSYYVAGWGMPFGRQLESQVLRLPEALSDGQMLTLKSQLPMECWMTRTRHFQTCFLKQQRALFSGAMLRKLSYQVRPQTILHPLGFSGARVQKASYNGTFTN